MNQQSTSPIDLESFKSKPLTSTFKLMALYSEREGNKGVSGTVNSSFMDLMSLLSNDKPGFSFEKLEHIISL